MIPGVRKIAIEKNQDDRGWLAEMYRETWVEDFPARQVNVMKSVARSLRGSHVHAKHGDYFYVAQGVAIAALKDVRKSSSSYLSAQWVELRQDVALVVPPGVVHGLFFPADSVLVTVESMYYDPSEEFRVKWDDPGLGLRWPVKDPILSENDQDAPSFSDMMEKLGPHQGAL